MHAAGDETDPENSGTRTEILSQRMGADAQAIRWKVKFAKRSNQIVKILIFLLLITCIFRNKEKATLAQGFY